MRKRSLCWNFLFYKHLHLQTIGKRPTDSQCFLARVTNLHGAGPHPSSIQRAGGATVAVGLGYCDGHEGQQERQHPKPKEKAGGRKVHPCFVARRRERFD